MSKQVEVINTHHGGCLSADDLYSYVADSPGRRSRSGLESHLSNCPRCRHELAEIMRLLEPEPQSIAAHDGLLSGREIESLLTVVKRASRNDEDAKPNFANWGRWVAAAAMVLVTIGLCLGGFSLYERSKSRGLSARGASLLQTAYAPQSQSELRLDLPFETSIAQRSSAGDDSLLEAERLFNQALGARSDSREARLGLGYIYLKKSEFSQAQKEFQDVLSSRGRDVQALVGLGVSRFEEGINSTDPLIRADRLGAASGDFQNALNLDPESKEARFNAARVLYELGRHQQALREIDSYLSRDSSSLWSTKLKDLKQRILMNRSEILEKEVWRAAKARDAPALSTLVRVALHQIPHTIRSLLNRAFEIESQPQNNDNPTIEDLSWAAGSMIATYEAATSDKSYSRMAAYYRHLTPSQRQETRNLVVELNRLVGRYNQNDVEAGIVSSDSLIAGLRRLGDYWALVRLYQLRGTSYYYGKADFSAASAEYQKMLECAEAAEDHDLIARSLAALAASYGEQHQYDLEMACLSRIRSLALAYHLDNWAVYASSSLGATNLSLNRPEESLREYLSALQGAYRLMNGHAILVALEGLGRALDSMDRYAEARNYFRESLARLDDFIGDGLLAPNPQNNNLRANLLSNEAYLSLDMGELQPAEQSFQNALRHSGGGQLELNARNHLGLARVYLEGKKFDQTQAEVDKVRAILAGKRYSEIAWQADSLQGFLLKHAGDMTGSLACFQRAIATLEGTRSGISSIELRRSFLNRRFDPYRESIVLLFHFHESPVRALEFADRAKCITLREYLAAGEKPEEMKNDSARLSPLPPGIVTLEYSLSNSEAVIFVTRAGDTAAVSVPLSLSALTASVKGYLQSIRNRDELTFKSLSQELYRDLIMPVQSTLASRHIDTLAIIPDGPLCLIPFAGLMNAEGRFLVEEFALSYAPSRTVLRYCLSKNRASGSGDKDSILLLDGASNLRGARNELADIAATYSERNRIVGARDIPSLGELAPKYELIHFAGHALVKDGRPRLLFPGPGEGTFLDSSTIEKWHLSNNRLVNLLGCNTASGPVFDGETAWGLVPAFLNAGAPSLIVSLLPVDDGSSAVLASQFYKNLAKGSVSKAEALCLSQRSLLKRLGPGALRRPGDWVPYALLGDPR